MKAIKVINMIAFVLLVIGGLNWLTYGIFELDFVAIITNSSTSVFSKIIYIAVGISAIWLVFSTVYKFVTEQNKTRI